MGVGTFHKGKVFLGKQITQEKFFAKKVKFKGD